MNEHNTVVLIGWALTDALRYYPVLPSLKSSARATIRGPRHVCLLSADFR
jgi:hypothetical protein